MGFFDDMSSKNALSSKINRLNDTIKKNYSELGIRYYNLFKDDCDPRFAELIDEINASYDQIKDAKAQLALLKGLIICPKCGMECAKELNFCTSCGQKLDKPVMNVDTNIAVNSTVPLAQEIAVSEALNDNACVDSTSDAAISTESVSDAVADEINEVCNDGNDAEIMQDEAQDVSPVLEFKFCTQCGTKAKGDAAFCTNCGNKFKV